MPPAGTICTASVENNNGLSWRPNQLSQMSILYSLDVPFCQDNFSVWLYVGLWDRDLCSVEADTDGSRGQSRSMAKDSGKPAILEPDSAVENKE